jgi:DNA-binding transcriptional regulator YiaG
VSELATPARDYSRWPIKPHQIISLRRKLNKTQVEFARLVSADPATVSRWESGKSRPRRIYVRFITSLIKEHS